MSGFNVAVNRKTWPMQPTEAKSNLDRQILFTYELRNKKGIIVQDFAYPNPFGAWEIHLRADYYVKKQSQREVFL